MTELERLIKIRDEYLAQNSHLKDFQAEITRILKRCPNQESKLLVLKGMMEENLEKLRKLGIELTENLKEVAQNLKS